MLPEAEDRISPAAEWRVDSGRAVAGFDSASDDGASAAGCGPAAPGGRNQASKARPQKHASICGLVLAAVDAGGTEDGVEDRLIVHSRRQPSNATSGSPASSSTSSRAVTGALAAATGSLGSASANRAPTTNPPPAMAKAAR